MTTRYHYFSHVENMNTGSLVLMNPFEEPRDQALVCRYELHRAKEDILDPDPNLSGAASWRRLLPISQGLPISQKPVLKMDSLPPQTTATLSLVRFNGELPFLAALPAARESGMARAFCGAAHPYERCLKGLGFEDLVFHEPGAYGSGLPEGLAALAKDHPGSADLSVWGNPYRLEGLKLIGLDMMRRFGESRPTLVVHDPTGELIMALELAAQSYRTFYGQPPFRTILVQQRPFAALCAAFEGVAPDWATLDQPHNQTCVKPPDPFIGQIVQHLHNHMGSAIAVDSDADVFEQALHLLARTGFVDDEDDVVLLSAENAFPP